MLRLLYSGGDLCVCVGGTSASIPISLYGIQVPPGVFRGVVMLGDYSVPILVFSLGTVLFEEMT